MPSSHGSSPDFSKFTPHAVSSTIRSSNPSSANLTPKVPYAKIAFSYGAPSAVIMLRCGPPPSYGEYLTLSSFAAESTPYDLIYLKHSSGSESHAQCHVELVFGGLVIV